jgi:hypothetical protein
MPTNFPTSLDNFTNPSSGDAMNSVVVPHADQHANANDAIEALEAKIGVNSSTVSGSIDYLLTNIASYNPGHRHTTLFNSSGSSVVFSNASGLVLDPGNSATRFIDAKSNINFAFDRYLNFSTNFNPTYPFYVISIDNTSEALTYGKNRGWAFSHSTSGSISESTAGLTTNLSSPSTTIGDFAWYGYKNNVSLYLSNQIFNSTIFGQYTDLGVTNVNSKMSSIIGNYVTMWHGDDNDGTTFLGSMIGAAYDLSTNGIVASAYGIIINANTINSSSQSAVGLLINPISSAGQASAFVRTIHLAGTGLDNRILFGDTTSLYSPTASTLQVDNNFIASLSLTAPTISGTTIIGSALRVNTIAATIVSGTTVLGNTVSGLNISGTTVVGTTVSGLSIVGSTITANAIRTTTFTTTAITTNTIIASTVSTTLASATVLLTPTITGSQVDFTGSYFRMYGDPFRLGMGTSSGYMNIWMDSNSGAAGIGNNLFYNGTSWTMANSAGYAINGSGTAVILNLFPNSTSGFQRMQAGAASGLVNILTWNSTGGVTIANDTVINGYVLGRGAGNVNGNLVFVSSISNNTSGSALITAMGVGALQSHTTGNSNTAFGYVAGNLITSQSQNTLIGARAGGNASGITNSVAVGLGALRYVNGDRNVGIGNNAYGGVVSGSTGFQNVAIGDSALINNTTGNFNMAIGTSTLYFNASGGANTAIGQQALTNNTASNNLAFGFNAMFLNASGTQNVAIGNEAMYNNLGSQNVAIGHHAMRYYVNNNFGQTAIGYLALTGNSASALNTGFRNTAIGTVALTANTSGLGNTAVGFASLTTNTSGSANTGVGEFTLERNTTGNFNVAVGSNALRYWPTATGQTAVGYLALTGNGTPANNTGTNNTAVGYIAGYQIDSGSNNTLVGFNTGGSLTSGNENTAVGRDALSFTTSGSFNTSFGHFSLNRNSTGTYNTANGYMALRYYQTGVGQTAIGAFALQGNSTVALNTGIRNTAVGYQALTANSSGVNNTAVGYNTLTANTSGNNNVAIGDSALVSNTAGGQNVAIGRSALALQTNADNNVAIGWQAAYSNTIGDRNVAVGRNALFSNTVGKFNVAIGDQALTSNVSGDSNTAVGMQALLYQRNATLNTGVGFNSLAGSAAITTNTGVQNAALGNSTLQTNTTGTGNCAFGSYTLSNNTVGFYNTAFGNQSMLQNRTGFQNVALGHNSFANGVSGSNNTVAGFQAYEYYTGSNQVAIGANALRGSGSITDNTGIQNTAVGTDALTTNTTGNDNTAVGYRAGNTNTTGSDNTYIGLDAKGAIAGNYQIGIGSGSQPTASNLGAWGGNTNATRTDFGLGTFTPLGRLHIETLLGTTSGLIIAGAPSQSANYLTILTSSVGGTTLFAVNASGVVTIGAPGGNNARLFASTANELRINDTLRVNSIQTSGLTITGNTTASGQVDIRGLTLFNNTEADQKFQIRRTGGSTFSIEHDAAGFYFYNVTAGTVMMRVFNAGNITMPFSLFTPSVTTNSFASSSVTGTTILAASALLLGAADTSMYRSSGGIIRTDTSLNVGRRVTSDVVTLTDSASITTDALLGNNFRVTLGGARSLTRPINPRDGQKITYEFRQDAVGGRTLTLDSSFRFGTDITSVTLSTSGNKIDFMTCIYTDTLSGFCVVGFIKGY